MTNYEKKSLTQCTNLTGLCQSLTRERTNTVKNIACGSKFHELQYEDKQLINGMFKELTEYEQYLHTLKDATFLNKYITLVQSFCQKRTRELYLELSEVIGKAFCNTLDNFLFELEGVYILHERLRGYLNCQSFRSWAIGSCQNKVYKYKELFRYNFPECDFNRPLIIRNPNMLFDNASKLFYKLIDVFSKFKNTRAFAISSTDLLWLGRLEYNGIAMIKSTDCSERLWLQIQNSMLSDEHCCIEYNAIWFPDFHMYVQFICKQRQCKENLFINWNQTSNCCDDIRQQALFERCQNSETIVFELYNREVVDWNLFCPFTLQLTFTQHDGCICPNDSAHIEKYRSLYEVDTVREDYLLILCKESSIQAGTYVKTEFKTCNITLQKWEQPLNQLLYFYKCVIETQDMQLLQTESQTRQIQNSINCIRKNIAMYQDLVGEYVHVNNIQAINKIRKLNEIIGAVEKMLVSEPLTVIATSKHNNKKYIIKENISASKSQHKKQDYKYEEKTHYKSDYDSDISHFSDEE